MKIKYITFISFMIFFMGCTKEKIISDLNLEGNWKIASYQAVGIVEITDFDVKSNVGNIGRLQSNILSIKLNDMEYKCLIDMSSKKLVDVYSNEYFNTSFKDPNDPKKFKLTSNVYEFDVKISRETKFYETKMVVDGTGNKIVIGLHGPIYLLPEFCTEFTDSVARSA